MLLKRTTQQPAAAEAEPPVPPQDDPNAQSPAADTSPALTAADTRTSSLSSDGYPDSPTLGAARGSATSAKAIDGQDKQDRAGKGLWGVPEEVHESVGMATPAGQLYPLRRSSRSAAPRAQFEANMTRYSLPISSCHPVEEDAEEHDITDESNMDEQQQPRLEVANLPETPPDSLNNDYQEYTFIRRAPSRAMFGMMETITEYSEEAESTRCGKERDSIHDVPVPPRSLSPSHSSITATTNVSRPSTRRGRDPASRESLSGSEPEPLALEDRLNMQAYVRAMAIYGGGTPERTSSIPQPIRAAPHKGSIGSLATMLTASNVSLSTGISTNITAQESTMSERLRQELDLMAGRGVAASPGGRPTTSHGNAGLPGIDTSNPFAFLATRSSSLASTSTITSPKPEAKSEVIPEPVPDSKPAAEGEGESRVPKDYLEGKWYIAPPPDQIVLEFLREPSKAKKAAAESSSGPQSREDVHRRSSSRRRSSKTVSPSSSNATKGSRKTVKLSSPKRSGHEGAESKSAADEDGKAEPIGHSSALHGNVRRWYLEEVMFTRIIANASTTMQGMSDISFLFVPESVRAQIRRLGEPLIQFGYEIQRYCLEYIEGYDLSWVISQWQQCQEGREDTPEGKKKKSHRDSAIEMCDPRGSPDCGCPLDRSCSHAGSSKSKPRQKALAPPLPVQLQLPPVDIGVDGTKLATRDSSLPNALAIQECDDVPANETPSVEASTRSDTPSSTSRSENTHASTAPTSPGPALKPRPRPLTDEEEDQLIRAINAVVTELTHMRDDLSEIQHVASGMKVFSLPTPESGEESQKNFRRLYGELCPPIPGRMDDLLALMEDKTEVMATILDGPDGGTRVRDMHSGPRITMAGGLGIGSPRMPNSSPTTTSPDASPLISTSSAPSSPKAPPDASAAEVESGQTSRLRTHIHHLLHTSQKTYPFRLAYAHAHLYALRKLYSCSKLDSFTYRSLISLEARLERLRQQDRVNDGTGSLCAMSHSVLSMTQGIQKRRSGKIKTSVTVDVLDEKGGVIAVATDGGRGEWEEEETGHCGWMRRMVRKGGIDANSHERGGSYQ
ncbi:hypothetical protein QBC40DRAFT_259099 [Triangularia verruculosa]|uniref:Uncharacterized protein n=1 Tax=Triangularia verruculosa TaxID=2587418 RepID=A0AAN6XCM2_9PEZI|nr:hypothetical protein QBC40DRAFT_259099 [Triangularia verruculosa]